MAPIRRFEDIEGWRKSRALRQAFSQTAHSAAFKDRALEDRMRRCAESAMSKIAESFDSGSNPEFVRFLNMAYRSLTEFQSPLYTGQDERVVPPREFDSLYRLAADAKSKVGSFIRSMKSHPRGRKA